MKTTMRTLIGTAAAAVTLAACSSTGPTAVHRRTGQPGRAHVGSRRGACGSRRRGPDRGRAMVAGRAGVDAGHVEPCRRHRRRCSNRRLARRRVRRPPRPCTWSTRPVAAIRSPPSRRARGPNWPTGRATAGTPFSRSSTTRPTRTPSPIVDLTTGAKQSFGGRPGRRRATDVLAAVAYDRDADACRDRFRSGDDLGRQKLAVTAVVQASSCRCRAAHRLLAGPVVDLDGILARCREVTFSSASQLWQVPVDGAAPTALTAVNSGQGDDPAFGSDLGDADAFALPDGTYLQSVGACGSAFLSRLTPDMHTTKVDVPGVDSEHSVLVKGVAGDKLVLQATMSCGSGDVAADLRPGGQHVNGAARATGQRRRRHRSGALPGG